MNTTYDALLRAPHMNITQCNTKELIRHNDDHTLQYIWYYARQLGCCLFFTPTGFAANVVSDLFWNWKQFTQDRCAFAYTNSLYGRWMQQNNDKNIAKRNWHEKEKLHASKGMCLKKRKICFYLNWMQFYALCISRTNKQSSCLLLTFSFRYSRFLTLIVSFLFAPISTCAFKNKNYIISLALSQHLQLACSKRKHTNIHCVFA